MSSRRVIQGLVGFLVLAIVTASGWLLLERYQNRLVVSEVKAALITELGDAWQLSEFEITAREMIGDSVQPIWKFRHISSATMISDKFIWEGWLFGFDLLRAVADKDEVADLSGVGQARFTGRDWEYTFDFDRALLVFPGDDASIITNRGVIIGEEDSDAIFARFSDETRTDFAAQVGNGWALTRFEITGLGQSGERDRPSWHFNYDGEISLAADRYSLVGRLFGVEVLQLVARKGHSVAVSGYGQAAADGQTFAYKFTGTAFPNAPGSDRDAFGDDAVVFGDEKSDALLARLINEARTAYALRFDGDLSLAQFEISDLEPAGTGEQSWWQFKYGGELSVGADRYSLAGRLFGVEILRIEANDGDAVAFSGRGKATANGPLLEFSFWGAGSQVAAAASEREAFGSLAVVVGTPAASELLESFASLAEQRFALVLPKPWSVQSFQVADFISHDQQRADTWAFDYTATIVVNDDMYVQRDVLMETPVLELKAAAGSKVDLRRSGTATETGAEYDFAFNVDLQALLEAWGKQRDFFPPSAVVFGTLEYDALAARALQSEDKYAVVVMEQPITWYQARDWAQDMGGSLATIRTQDDQEDVWKAVLETPESWVRNSAGYVIGPWLGGYQRSGAGEPSEGWQWVNGTPFTFSNWNTVDRQVGRQPNNSEGIEDALVFMGFGEVSPWWNDYPSEPTGRGWQEPIRSFVIERGASQTTRFVNADLSGTWVGTTTAGAAVFDYRWQIEQTGKSVAGTIELKMQNARNWSRYRFDGKLSGGVLTFRGTEWETSGNGSFCLASGQLLLTREGNRFRLDGKWGGNSVVGGCPMGTSGGVSLVN